MKGTILPLVATQIAVHYGRMTVFRDLDCDIRAGRIYFLTGENGSGKTTLIRSLSTLRRIHHG